MSSDWNSIQWNISFDNAQDFLSKGFDQRKDSSISRDSHKYGNFHESVQKCIILYRRRSTHTRYMKIGDNDEKNIFSFSLLRGWWKLRQTAEGLTLKWSSPSVLRSTHSATSKELKKTQNLMMGLKYSAETNIILDIKYFCRFWCKIWWLWHILWCGGLNGGLLPQITFTTPRHNVPLPPHKPTTSPIWDISDFGYFNSLHKKLHVVSNPYPGQALHAMQMEKPKKWKLVWDG